jgi:oxygen-dependent protoporphyrinogen oxidase
VEVVVLEASDRVGGKLSLVEVGGVTVDTGAEAMLNRRPEAVELARATGLVERLVHPATTSAALWSRGRMHPMPRSVMGVPTDVKALSESGLLSRSGAARAALDAVLPATELGDSDVSVGWLIEQRLGREVLDRLVEPLLGGVYAGHARELSARAAVPQVVALLERDRSLTRAAAASLEDRGSSEQPVFAGLAGGVGQLAAAVAAEVEVRTGTAVRDLLPSAEGGWHVVTGPASDPSVLRADAVVVATPAAPAARMFAGAAPDAALELAGIEYASMAVVTLAFPARDFPAVQGSGFLVPPVDRRQVKAATYSFNKWDWVRAASDEVVVLRVSIGRHREEAALQASDEELVARAVTDLTTAVGLSVLPVDRHVHRWGGALPQYAVGHPERVRRIREAVARLPGLAVCGAAYDGLGLPACISSAHKAAEQVLGQLPAPVRAPRLG